MMIKSLSILCLLLYWRSASAIDVHDLFDVIDLGSVDLANFQYFRNLPSKNPKTAAQANLFLEHFQKKKAVLDYFENLFFGNSPFSQHSDIPFDPHYGRAWRPYFERKYGRRGEHLIRMLGSGYSLQELRRQGAIPQDFGRIYYPS